MDELAVATYRPALAVDLERAEPKDRLRRWSGAAKHSAEAREQLTERKAV